MRNNFGSLLSSVTWFRTIQRFRSQLTSIVGYKIIRIGDCATSNNHINTGVHWYCHVTGRKPTTTSCGRQIIRSTITGIACTSSTPQSDIDFRHTIGYINIEESWFRIGETRIACCGTANRPRSESTFMTTYSIIAVVTWWAFTTYATHAEIASCNGVRYAAPADRISE